MKNEIFRKKIVYPFEKFKTIESVFEPLDLERKDIHWTSENSTPKFKHYQEHKKFI